MVLDAMYGKIGTAKDVINLVEDIKILLTRFGKSILENLIGLLTGMQMY